MNLRLFSLLAVLSSSVACTTASEPDEPAPKPCVTLPTATLASDACDPGKAKFSLASKNRYYPLIPGNVTVLEGNDDGELVRVERRVLAETMVVAGVTTHVLEAKELKDGKLYEVARNFYVEAENGTVCYFGEDVTFYNTDGSVANNKGSWRAGVGDAKPGIIMPATPAPGQFYYQENAPGIAQDMGRIASVDKAVTLGGTSYTAVVTIEDSNPIEDCATVEEKLYAPGVGEAGDTTKKLVSFTPGTP